MKKDMFKSCSYKQTWGLIWDTVIHWYNKATKNG